MIKWDLEKKIKLLLAVIEQSNPTGLNWNQLATAMGPEFTVEAVRQQYALIKRSFKSSNNGGASKNSPSTTTTSKSKNNSTGTTRGRKRKASVAGLITSDDDEEQPKSAQKVKPERAAAENGEGGMRAEVFKMEDDEGVDLVNDGLYDAI